MPKYNVSHTDSVKKLRQIVPSSVRHQIPRLQDTKYAVVLFRSGNKDIVLSRVAASAIEEIPKDEQIVAIGSFTAEALSVLGSRGAIILLVSDFHWTDASWVKCREC